MLDKATLDTRCQIPDKIMRSRDFYRQEPVSEERGEYHFENFMGTSIEPQIKYLITKIIKEPQDLTDDELLLFIGHLTLQRIKVPKQLKIAKIIGKTIVENAAMKIPEVADGLRKKQFTIVIKDQILFNHMRAALSVGLYRYFLRMIWNVWAIPNEMHLITSDNPVTIFNPYFLDENLEPGIGLLGSIVLYPLCPRHCLMLTHPESETEDGFDPLQPIEAPPRGIDHRILIRGDRTLPPEMAETCNRVIALYSDRFLVSGDVKTLENIKNTMLGQESKSHQS